MKIFSIDLSSRRGSIAVVDDGAITQEIDWMENFGNRQSLFDAMDSLKMDWERVDLFAVGRGPGAFSGLRIGFSVVNALAAPGNKPVYALNSGVSLAARYGDECTVVMGDARRGQVWAGLYQGIELKDDFRLMDAAEFQQMVPEDALVVSPDRDRLAELLGNYRTPSAAESVNPAAGELGKIIFQRVMDGKASEPLEPLYMHPPVFVEPRFPA